MTTNALILVPSRTSKFRLTVSIINSLKLEAHSQK